MSAQYFELFGMRLIYSETTFVGKLLFAFTGLMIGLLVAEAFKQRKAAKKVEEYKKDKFPEI